MADNIEINYTRDTTATKINNNIYNKPPVIDAEIIDNKTDVAVKQDEGIKKKYDKRLDNLKPAQKGEIRNPSGRPKTPDIVKQMFKSAAPEAVKLLVDTMNDGEEKKETRLKCAETILDRVYGKPTQPIDGLIENTIQLIYAPTVKSWGD